jgi:formylglycine-generating enzyme required for sulfatase activity
MLYHLLAGQAPYERPGVKQDNYAVLGLLQEGPPTALHELARDQPAELVAICEKAMARVEQDRYADMMELAEDLRAWLEGRVVRAYRTGALAELRKWVARNPQLAAMSAAALVLLVAGLAAVGYVQSRGREAAERERAVAERERGNVLRLSAFQKMADLRAEAEELWPAAPGRIADYERWLAEAAGLAPELDFARAQRDELRARALPLTAEERQRSHAMHPRYAQLVALQAERAALARAQAVRRGEDEPEAVELDMGVLPDGSHELASLAWPLVEPARTEFGRETEGLALAREALERARNDDDRSRSGRALAWASFACGLDEQALETAWRVRDGVGEALLGQAEDLLAEVEAAVHGAQQGEVAARLAQLDAELPALEAAVDERLLWTFEHDEDRWWHEQLTKLIGELEAFFDAGTGLVRGTSPESGWGIERRLDFARRVQESSVDGPDARRRWDEAIASIADERECPAYGGLRIRPQLGLLPVGRDPDSGLWEFVHLQSGSVPARDAQGRLVLEQDTGIVLVLLPAGTFWMGAQATDPEAPDYDPAAAPDEEPVHQVTLWPFFLARHELTQSQWTGFTGSNPSTYTDDFPGEEASDGGLHPVENVSWVECDRVLRQMGLLLPTEAQWEYGARGGTQTPWWTGAQRESLAGAVNFGDAAALRFGAIWPALSDWLDDGFAVHAHAGGLSANAFGLEQVHGNVGEWCRERWSSYTAPHALGDGERHPTGFPNRIVRGGAFVFPVDASRVTARPAWESTYRSNFIGARAARPLER